MLNKLFKRRGKPPSERMAVAYEAGCQQVITWLNQGVRRWENQPIQHRKMQLILGLAGLLLLGSLSVYFTATGQVWPGLARPGHFHTRINQKHHEPKFRQH